MCTYLTSSAPVAGSALGADGWFNLGTAVVYFDHPQEAAAEHALCIDFRPTDGTDAARRVAVELDAASARALAAQILATLDHEEVRALTAE